MTTPPPTVRLAEAIHDVIAAIVEPADQKVISTHVRTARCVAEFYAAWADAMESGPMDTEDNVYLRKVPLHAAEFLGKAVAYSIQGLREIPELRDLIQDASRKN